MFEGQKITITRDMLDDRKAIVMGEKLYDIQWRLYSGGLKKKAPTWGIYARILCTDIIAGDNFGHSCAHDNGGLVVNDNVDKGPFGKGPHEILVYISKKYNDPQIYKEFVKLAGKKPKMDRAPLNVSNRIREIVIDQPGITPNEIKNIIKAEVDKKYYDDVMKTIDNSIRRLKKGKLENKANIVSVKFKNTQKLYPEGYEIK